MHYIFIVVNHLAIIELFCQFEIQKLVFLISFILQNVLKIAPLEMKSNFERI